MWFESLSECNTSILHVQKDSYSVSSDLHCSFKECLLLSYAYVTSILTYLNAVFSIYVINIKIPYLKTVLVGDHVTQYFKF